MKGNRSNHPKKWARDEDLKEFKQRFYDFVSNDFAGLKREVFGLRTDISWLKKLTIGLILVVLASAVAIIISQI